MEGEKLRFMLDEEFGTPDLIREAILQPPDRRNMAYTIGVVILVSTFAVGLFLAVYKGCRNFWSGKNGKTKKSRGEKHKKTVIKPTLPAGKHVIELVGNIEEKAAANVAVTSIVYDSEPRTPPQPPSKFPTDISPLSLDSPSAPKFSNPLPPRPIPRVEHASAPGPQTPLADAYARGDFSILKSTAPQLYKTLFQTGMLNGDGTSTKKMRSRSTTPSVRKQGTSTLIQSRDDEMDDVVESIEKVSFEDLIQDEDMGVRMRKQALARMQSEDGDVDG